MKRSFLYRNSLSITFIALFLFAWAAQTFFGWQTYIGELKDEGQPPIPLPDYLHTGHFVSATFENFQSEFLQMALYVILTIFLRQIGSAESKSLDKKEEVDREPQPREGAPKPVLQGGWRLYIYKHSLSIAFVLLFFITWYIHLLGSLNDFNFQNELKGKPTETLSAYLSEPQFWFETFQNWQSEFLSVAAIVVFTIFLRQKGSPESKPVDSPHLETGK